MIAAATAVIACALAAPQGNAGEGAVPSFRARIELPGDRVLSGEVFLDGAGRLAMTSRALEGVTVLDAGALRGLHRTDALGRALSAELEFTADDDVLTLLGGGTLVGRAVALDDEELDFESRGLGRVEITRDRIGVIARGAEDGRGFEGIAGATDGSWEGWEFSHEGSGGDVTRVLTKAGAEALLRRDLDGTYFAIAVGWDRSPSLRIVIGEPADEQLPRGVAFEIWGGHPTLVGHDGEELKLAHAADVTLPEGSGGVLHMTISRESGVRALGFETYEGGWLELDLALPLDVPPDVIRVQAPGGPLTFFGGPVVGPLAGEDGRVEPQRVVRGAEVVSIDDGVLHLPQGRATLDDVVALDFAPPQRRGELEPSAEVRSQGWLELVGGERIAVMDIRLTGGRFVVRSPQFGGEVAVELDAIHSIIFPRGGEAAVSGDYRFHFGPGAGVSARFEGIERGADGVRVVMSEPGFVGVTAARIDGAFKMTRDGRAEARLSRAEFPTDVVLQSGEAFPAAIVEADGAALTLVTPLSRGPVRLPGHLVRAIVFAPRRMDALLAPLGRREARNERPGARIVIVRGGEPTASRDPAQITEAELERALLVPRADANDPGRVLLVARNGDLMRTNLVGYDVDPGRARVAGAGGGSAEIPADRLAAIVWLESGETGAEAAEGPPHALALGGEWTADASDLGLVTGEIVRATAEEVVLDHPALGTVRIPGRALDALSAGIRVTGRYPILSGWRTRPMPEPRFDGR